jgi:hypothetical protein
MKEIEVNKTRNLVVPEDATAVQIVHEWGDVVATTTGLTEGNNYSFTPDSIGAHSVIWKAGATVIKTDYYNVYMPLITATEFFASYPDHELDDEKFPMYERRARAIIETFTGQKFGPYENKTIRIQGEDGHTLEIPYRVRNLSSLSDVYGADFTDYVEVAPGTNYFLQRRHAYRHYADIKADISVENNTNFFTHRLDFVITGDFGWPYVPADVSEAAAILIDDEFTNAGDLRKHGFNEAQLGDFSYKLNADQWGTTGNTQVDLMLAPYVQINLGLI